MRLSISTLACPNWSLPEIVGAAAAHGINGIDFRGVGAEIDITRLPLFDAELDTTLDLLARHALQMPCLNTSITLVTPAPERWQMMLDECLRYARLAGRARTPFIRIFGGEHPKGMTTSEALIMARRHLRQLVKLCRPHQCRPLLETHDAWATTGQVMPLLEDLDPLEAGVLWDIEHSHRHGEAPLATAAGMRTHIQHVHVKDSVYEAGKYLPRLLGEGDLPLVEMLQALRGIEYDGWFCLETEKRWHAEASPEPEQSLPQFARWMRERWKS